MNWIDWFGQSSGETGRNLNGSGPQQRSELLSRWEEQTIQGLQCHAEGHVPSSWGWGALQGLCAGKGQGQRWDVVGKDTRRKDEGGASLEPLLSNCLRVSLAAAGLYWFCLVPTEGQGCTAYDVAVNSDFYRRMQVGGGAAGEAWAGASPSTRSPSAVSLSYS